MTDKRLNPPIGDPFGPQSSIPTWAGIFPKGSSRGYTLEMAEKETRQDERRKCWETVKGLLCTLDAPDFEVRCVEIAAIKYAANSIRPEGEEQI